MVARLVDGTVKVDRWLARPLMWLVRGYQLLLSPLMGGQCRFYPTCSHYAHEALAEHGALAGSALALKRLLRCHPWHPGGADPVPDHKH